MSLPISFLTASARTRRGAVRLMAVIVAPVVLAFLLVMGFSAALGGSDRVPVAVVNLDRGSEGADLVDSLVDTSELSWHAVGEDDVARGLADGTYALAVKIPADYSERVGSLDGDAPEKAEIDLVSNGAGNVLAQNAATAVMRQVQSRLKTQVGGDYILGVLNDVRSRASSLSLTSDGAVMLDQGYDALSQGAGALGEGISQAADGAGQLSEGITGVAQGADALGTGAAAISTGIGAVRARGVEPLATGAGALSQGLGVLAKAQAGLGQGVSGNAAVMGALEKSVESGYAGLSSLDLEASKKTIADDLAALREALGTADTGLSGVGEAATDASASLGSDAADRAASASRDASSLAASLSSGNADEPGLAERSRGVARATGSAADAVQGVLDSPDSTLSDVDRAALEKAVADLRAGSDDASSVADGLDAASAAARGVSSEASSLSDGIRSAQGSVDAAAQAAGSLDDVRAALDKLKADVEKTVTDTSAGLTQVTASVAASHGILAGYEAKAGMSLSASTAALGSGITASAGQLGPEGSVGQGAAGLAGGLSALGQALDPLATGAGQLVTGAQTLSGALSAVGTGAGGLATGLDAMAGSTGGLVDGVGQLKEASGKVTGAMGDTADALLSKTSGAQDRADAASSPVTLNLVGDHVVEGVPGKLAPAMAALALWAGVAAVILLMPALDLRAALAGRRLLAVLEPFGMRAAVSAVQALLIWLALLALGAGSAGPGPLLAVLLLAALSFSAVAQLAQMLFGRAALPVMTALLALQAVCAGAVLPVGLAAAPLEALGTVMPATLASGLLRVVIAGAPSVSTAALAGLVGMGLVSLAACLALVPAHMRVRPERDLA